jgi:hypothetical protein
MMTRGEIPDGLYICHLCDEKLCCNPEHLDALTPKENTMDCARKGRLNHANYQYGHEKCTPENFWQRTTKRKTGCWEWNRSTDHKGYGKVRFDGKMRMAHRVAYTLIHGSIPEGMLICHACDNKLCCNPKHLFPGTAADNARDFVEKGLHSSAATKLTDKQAVKIRKLYADGTHTYQELSEMFNMSLTSIGDIIRGTSFKHLL